MPHHQWSHPDCPEPMNADGGHGEGGHVDTAHLHGRQEEAEEVWQGPVSEHCTGAHEGDVEDGRRYVTHRQ